MRGGREFPSAEGGTEWIRVCVALPVEGEICLAERRDVGLFCASHTAEGAWLMRCEVPRSEGEACITRQYHNIECMADLECRGDVCMQPCK